MVSANYLGIKVTKLSDGTITLNQPHLIDSILKDLNLQSARTTGRSTPALSSVLLYRDIDHFTIEVLLAN